MCRRETSASRLKIFLLSLSFNNYKQSVEAASVHPQRSLLACVHEPTVTRGEPEANGRDGTGVVFMYSIRVCVCNRWLALKALDRCLQTDESGENYVGRDHWRVTVHSAHKLPCGPPPLSFIFISSPARPECPFGLCGGDSSVNHSGLVEHPAFYTL